LRFIEDGFFQYKLPFLANEYYEDKNAIGATDFIGLNYYSHFHVKLSFTDLRSLATVREDEVPLMTDMMYPIYPEGFYRALKRVAQLGKPIIVTENGIADSKDEWKRDLFIKRYLYALSKAIQEGLPIKGYYYWSLYDNFEWAEGYEMRFGLYEIDFKDPSLPRKLRKGASFFVKAIENYFKTH
jgi:beta-glucosidase